MSVFFRDYHFVNSNLVRPAHHIDLPFDPKRVQAAASVAWEQLCPMQSPAFASNVQQRIVACPMMPLQRWRDVIVVPQRKCKRKRGGMKRVGWITRAPPARWTDDGRRAGSIPLTSQL